ncbi:MAG: dTMP kinase [Hydrogenovibrio sp.]|uniref:dTMP kinase n=1 Tax=Hydrogenovibrio sp. TaxID=2065821 RepID=UPI0028704BC0|nr:dTMP kinase [Hydrogenovibrio sp.]MDR9498066.1 dTMP kinase [Hydrogenovibrio sp.]
MTNATRPGQFITLEGTEGAGKSTNLAFIEQWLSQRGVPLLVTREPGGTELSEAIRGLLLDKQYSDMTDLTELLLMFAARHQHLHRKILPALEAGTWVVCDRFTDATYAYQGAGRGMNPEVIAQLETLVQDDFRPDLTLIMDLPVATGQARVNARSAAGGPEVDRFEQERTAFFEAVRGAYLLRAEAEPDRYAVIDASRSLESVQSQTQAVLEKALEVWQG